MSIARHVFSLRTYPAPARISLMSLLSLLSFGCTNLRAKYDARLLDEHGAQPLATAPLLEEADLAHLPPPVQRFVRRSGAVGRPRVQNFKAEFEAEMFRKPGGAPMRATSVQVNFLGKPTRLFHMKARMAGLPVQAYHVYADAQAAFRVRVASLVDVVDQQGDLLSVAETVTVLNDMCFFAPGSLVDPRIAWEPLDDRRVKATFTNGPRRGSAVLRFNERDELVDFVSEDRPEFRDGEYRRHPWSTPIEGYRVIDGMRLPTRGAAVYKHPEGDFTYGRFVLKSIAYDVRAEVAP